MNTLGNIVATVLCLWFGGIILGAAWRHFAPKGVAGFIGMRKPSLHERLGSALARLARRTLNLASIFRARRVPLRRLRLNPGRTANTPRPNYYGVRDEIMRRILEARLDE